MIYCPNCGMVIKDLVRFCPDCGEKLDIDESDFRDISPSGKPDDSETAVSSSSRTGEGTVIPDLRSVHRRDNYSGSSLAELKIGPLTSYRKFVYGFFDFNGITSRADFWWPVVLNFFILVLLFITVLTQDYVERCFGIEKTDFTAVNVIMSEIAMKYLYAFLIVTLVPNLALTVRRLRDSGTAWQFIFFLLVPVAGLIILIIKLCKASEVEGATFACSYESNPDFSEKSLCSIAGFAFIFQGISRILSQITTDFIRNVLSNSVFSIFRHDFSAYTGILLLAVGVLCIIYRRKAVLGIILMLVAALVVFDEMVIGIIFNRNLTASSFSTFGFVAALAVIAAGYAVLSVQLLVGRNNGVHSSGLWIWPALVLVFGELMFSVCLCRMSAYYIEFSYPLIIYFLARLIIVSSGPLHLNLWCLKDESK